MAWSTGAPTRRVWRRQGASYWSGCPSCAGGCWPWPRPSALDHAPSPTPRATPLPRDPTWLCSDQSWPCPTNLGLPLPGLILSYLTWVPPTWFPPTWFWPRPLVLAPTSSTGPALTGTCQWACWSGSPSASTSDHRTTWAVITWRRSWPASRRLTGSASGAEHLGRWGWLRHPEPQA